MKRLWNLPFNLSQCFIPIFLFGTLVSWYFLLINDQYFTEGRNTLRIVVFHVFLIFVFMMLLNFNVLKIGEIKLVENSFSLTPTFTENTMLKKQNEFLRP